MKETRSKAQTEALLICKRNFHVTREERFTRNVASNTIGKSWTNILDVVVGGDTRVSNLQKAIDQLREKGYVVSVESDEVITIHVSTSYEVVDRLGEEE